MMDISKSQLENYDEYSERYGNVTVVNKSRMG